MAKQTDSAATGDEQVALNTDRELWRKGDGDGNGMSYYEPSIHVTEGGDIGINVGGHVCVLPVEEWHSLVAGAWRNEVPRGLRCLLLGHPWRWSANALYLRSGVSFKVCTKRGCVYGR